MGSQTRVLLWGFTSRRAGTDPGKPHPAASLREREINTLRIPKCEWQRLGQISGNKHCTVEKKGRWERKEGVEGEVQCLYIGISPIEI